MVPNQFCKTLSSPLARPRLMPLCASTESTIVYECDETNARGGQATLELHKS